MPRVVMVLNNPTLKMADTQGALATGKSFECQVTSAVVSAIPVFTEIPATGCAGASQSPGKTGYQLDIAWLDDWSAGAALSLSSYAFTNDGQAKWFELTPDKNVTTTKLVGNCYVVSGSFGGSFGDGTPASSTATWPLLDKPTSTIPALEETAAPESVPA